MFSATRVQQFYLVDFISYAYQSYLLDKNVIFNHGLTEAVVQRCSVKKVLLEISKNSQENTCARDSFSIKKSLRPAGSGTGVFL